MSFDDCLPVILASEGGFVNDPHDPGGPTNLGITQGTLSTWLGRPATVADVQALTPQTVAPIYQKDYWDAAHCGDCPAGVDLMVFDTAVNQGGGLAIRTLQAAVGVAVDGVYGPATAAAVEAADPATTVGAIAAARDAYYRSLPDFPRYGNGWLARVARTQAAALAMVG